MSRNTNGIIGWTALTLVLSAVITLPTMICREWYQCTQNGIENGHKDYRISTITKIEEVLGCSLILVPNEDVI